MTQAIALLAVGAAAYYVAPLAIRVARPAPPPPEQLTPLAAVEVPDTPADRSGDRMLVNSLVTLERRSSVAVEVVQSGELMGQRIESAGTLRQLGRGPTRRFSLRLEGRVGDAATRLRQVSDGAFLHTDVAWGDAAEPTRRSVTRIDLRRLLEELDPSSGDASRPSPVGAGEAAAAPLDPSAWAALGGLPMLMESLGANFHFGAPRRMRLHNEPVFAMVGRWKPAGLDALSRGEGADADAATLRRLPHHVLLALGASDLFPYLVEYRSIDDPLAAPGLTDDQRLHESRGPLLRMEFRRPRFDEPIAASEFRYRQPADAPLRDVTDARLANLRRRMRLQITARGGSPPRRR